MPGVCSRAPGAPARSSSQRTRAVPGGSEIATLSFELLMTESSKSRVARATTHESGDGNTIRVVAARTGFAMGTLRAWERRYGFPRPERRARSNRRLYSSADVDRLLAIQRALGHGYRVGDVIGKTLLELAELPALSNERGPEPMAQQVAITRVDQLLDLLARDQVSELEVELRRAAAALGPKGFVTQLAHPFAVGIGELWVAGRLSVHHEHLATECLVTQIRQMLASYQDIQAAPLVLLATLPGELHTLPLQMVALYLVVAGAKPRLLGGSTPPREVAESARLLGADAVGITVTLASELKQTRKDVRSLRKHLTASVPLWIGGAGANALGISAENTKVVGTWDAIDQAVIESRGRRTE